MRNNSFLIAKKFIKFNHQSAPWETFLQKARELEKKALAENRVHVTEAAPTVPTYLQSGIADDLISIDFESRNFHPWTFMRGVAGHAR